jgi:hypothetical protein
MLIGYETYDQKIERISRHLKSDPDYTPIPIDTFLVNPQERPLSLDTILDRIKVANPYSRILVVKGRTGLNCFIADTAAGLEIIRRGKNIVGIYDQTMDIDRIYIELRAIEREYKYKGSLK